jgi:hypothetical protein
MAKVLQLKISLLDTKPVIWRQVLVEGDYTFLDLHNIVQTAMGWDNYHLYEFTSGGLKIGSHDDDDAFGFEEGEGVTDAETIMIDEVLVQQGDTVKYLYDFGDGWKHLIKVEKVLDEDEAFKFPVLIKGEWNCPPEDCGGIGGYYDLLKVLKDKNHPGYKEMTEWLGREYDPKMVDVDRINEELKEMLGE